METKVATLEATNKLILELEKTVLDLIVIGDRCRLLYGFWISDFKVAKGTVEELTKVVKLLTTLGDLCRIEKSAKEDSTLMDILERKKTVEADSEMTSFEAIAKLVEILKSLSPASV